jgi:hypothetical protein
VSAARWINGERDLLPLRMMPGHEIVAACWLNGDIANLDR